MFPRSVEAATQMHQNSLQFKNGMRYLHHVSISGLLPWNAMPGKACGMTLASICKTSEVSR